MAHYARKYRINDVETAHHRCFEQMQFLFETTETDYYFTEYAPGQFQRIRTYSPPIRIQRHPDTGETTPELIHLSQTHPTLAEFIAAHRLILSDSTPVGTHYSDLVVLDIPHGRQKEEFLRVMQKNRPLDSVVIKERYAFWYENKDYPVLVHLDESVSDEEHGSVGSYMEFEIKLPPGKTLPSATVETLFTQLEALFDDVIIASEPRHYRDILRETFGDYGALVKTLPSATLNTLKALPEIRFLRNERIIKDFEENSTDAFFILDGAVDVRYSNGLLIRTIGKHDFFGEMAIETGIRTADVIAREAVTAKHIPSAFLRRLSNDITLANHFMHRLRQDEIKKTLQRRNNASL